jgi:hypothetical protein
MSNPISTEFKASVDAIVEELVSDAETKRAAGEKVNVTKADVIYVIGTRHSIPEYQSAVFDEASKKWDATGGGSIYDGLSLLGCFSGFSVGKGKTGIQRKVETPVVVKPTVVKLPALVLREAAKSQVDTSVSVES